MAGEREWGMNALADACEWLADALAEQVGEGIGETGHNVEAVERV